MLTIVTPRTALSSRDKLFPVLLRNAPALEELHVVCHLPPVNEYDTEDSDEPLIEALLAHGGLHVLTLHGASLIRLCAEMPAFVD